jgi:hypothetical protein
MQIAGLDRNDVHLPTRLQLKTREGQLLGGRTPLTGTVVRTS